MRRILIWSAIAALCFVAERLAGRPPEWLFLDPLERPFGLAPRDSLALPTASDSEPALPLPTFPIAVNHADAATLRALPGVGPVLADRILEHREREGSFRSLPDLDAVPGIGPRTLERWAGLIRFEDAVGDSMR